MVVKHIYCLIVFVTTDADVFFPLPVLLCAIVQLVVGQSWILNLNFVEVLFEVIIHERQYYMLRES